MKRSGLVGAAVAAVGILAGGAEADDQPFLTITTTDIQPAHGREVEQTLGQKTVHAGEAFTAFKSQSEIEYGFTDDLQGALYLNYEWERVRPHAPPGAAEQHGTVGLSGELIWRVLNPYFDPVGLAIYLEPSIAPNTREFETKILLQKNLLNDRLRNVLNVNFEDVWEKNALGSWDKSSALEFNLGSSFNVTPDFSVGLELDNEREFDGLVLGGSAVAVANSYFLGPTLQLIGHPWTITAGFQTQMPWATDPSHTPGTIVNGRTADAEHFRAGIRFSRDL